METHTNISHLCICILTINTTHIHTFICRHVSCVYVRVRVCVCACVCVCDFVYASALHRGRCHIYTHLYMSSRSNQ